MKIDATGLMFIKTWEGCELHVYKDSAGYETIGIGHLITNAEKQTGYIYNIAYKSGITEQEALHILDKDLVRFEECVNEKVAVPLYQNMYNSLVSLSFNIGTGAFADSTLLKLLNAGEYHNVPDQFVRWNKAGGQVVQGLVNRRNAEVVQWCCHDEFK